MRKKRDNAHAHFSSFNSRLLIFLRGAVPLLLAVLALLAAPTLFVWWLRGGPFGVGDLLIGGAISVALLIAAGIVFGWAVSQIGRAPRK